MKFQKKKQDHPVRGLVVLDDSLFFSRTLDFLEVYIPKQSDGSKNTVDTYRFGLSAFRKYVVDEKKISIRKFKFADCTYDFILDYRNWLHDTKGYKESTVNNRLATIKSYINYASSRNITLQQVAFAISEVPMYTIPKVIRPIIEDTDALSALLNAPKNTRLGLRDRTLLILLFDTAIRVDELVSLDFSDVNIYVSEPYIHVYGKGDKERKVYLSSETIPHIKQYIDEFHRQKERNKPFFYTTTHGICNYMSRRNAERIVEKYADQIRKDHPDLPKSVYPHMFRRTRATGLYRDNVDITVISSFLGHANIQTTKDHYASPSVEQMRKVIEFGIPADEIEEPEWTEDEEDLAKLCGLK